MQVHKVALSELFSNRKRYVVPLFQRPYVWTEERQWEPLWNDVADRAEAVLQTPSPGRPKDHFMGAIVTAPRPSFGIGVPAAEVIDGQQRLTTLQLLLHAFRDVSREVQQDAFAEAIDALLKNVKPWAHPTDEHKVWPTNLDQQVFATVVRAGSAEAVMTAFPQQRKKYKRNPEPRPRIAEAYLRFSSWIRDFLGQAPAAPANALYTALVSHLQLVHIELEPGEDPQAIFEALNGRGEPLTPADLIKNYLFRQVGGSQEEAYAQYWKPLDEAPAEDRNDQETRFWRRHQRQGRLRRSRLDLLLFQYLIMRKGSEVLIGSLFRDFQAWHESSGEEVTRTLQDILDHARVFEQLLVPTGNTRLDVFARRIRALDTSTIYPVVLYMLGEGRPKLGLEQLPKILDSIESYLVRRAICRMSSKSYNHDFLQLLKQLRAASTIDADLVAGFLMRLEGEHHEWPDDNAFQTAWMTLPVYQLMGPSRTATILRAINDAEFSKFHEVIEVRSPLTVEHVMPQKWTQFWDPPAISGVDKATATRMRDTMLHTFGNLTLITGALNGRVKNAAFSLRRPELAKKSVLQLNVWFQEVDSWDEAQIERRGEALFQVAKRVWPRPTSPAGG